MKTWTITELDHVVGLLQPLVGLRLQEVMSTERDVVLGFYSTKGLLWLWVDLSAVNPCLLPWSELPLRPPQKKNPLFLFLRAHFVGRVLRDVQMKREFGRVVDLRFGSEPEDPALELRLFPHGRNVLAKAQNRQIAWQKPEALSRETLSEARGPVRSLDELREQWLASRGTGGKGKASKADPRARLESELKKKQNALEKVRQELQRKQDLPWRELGEWLKVHQSLDVPAQWVNFVDKRRKLAWNIEECFAKARDVEGKVFGTEKRLRELKDSIADLEAKLARPQTLNSFPAEPKRASPLADADAHGRTMKISEDLIVIAGKSAADNLKLLRKARAWDLWFHMRDYPSSHAILFRNKTAKVGSDIEHRICEWFIRNHFGAKASQHAGEKFDILIVECRFVRPIKGDKVGRVTYRDERILTHKFTDA